MTRIDVDYEEVLTFWFTASSRRNWFGGNDAFDETIRQRVGNTYARAARGATAHWRGTPRGRVAEVIVLDQFPRNMFRGTPRAFATDEQALALAQDAVAARADRRLPAALRHFLYMPFMHSESKEVHRRAVRLFLPLPPWRWGALVYELQHKRVIDRFGRYPHRNAVLGRASTPDELEFLQMHPGF